MSGAHVVERVRIVGPLASELEVGLVHDGDDVPGQPGEEAIEVAPGHVRAGRVVGVGEGDELRGGADAPQEGVDVGNVPGLRRDLDERRSGAPGRDREHPEDPGRHHDLFSRVDEGAGADVDELAGPASDDDLLRGNAVALRERAAEERGRSVRVEVHGGRDREGRGHRLRRGAQRVLVGGELHGAGDPELTLDVLDRSSRDVRGELLYRRARGGLQLFTSSSRGADGSAWPFRASSRSSEPVPASSFRPDSPSPSRE